jgi:glycosyl transferase family 87
MFGFYVVAVVCVGALRPRWALGAIVLVQVLVFLGPPILSADVFGYIDWARMGALHGFSPYTHDSGTVVSDAVYGFVRWDRYTSPYGPVFTLLSYAFVPLGVGGALWAFKTVALLSSLAICGLVWDGAGRLGMNRGTAVALYGLNPTVLVYALGGVHNDLLAMAVVMAGCVLVLHGRDATGGAGAALGATIKASAGVVLPFLVLGAARRRRALAGAVAVTVAVAAVGFAVFGVGSADSVAVIGNQQKLASGTTVTAQLGDWLGYSGAPPLARAVAGVILAIALGWLLWRTWRGASWLESAAWATLAVLITTSWLLPWYVVWLLPLAALTRGRTLRIAAVGMSGFAVATHMALIATVPTSSDLRPLLHPAACLGSGQAGCPGRGPRTQPVIIDHSVQRAFRLAYQAKIRMATGHRQARPVRYARVRCRAQTGAEWTCRVKYFMRGRRERHRAVYATQVDTRGCFTATSSEFTSLVYEAVLGRMSPNPLARLTSCP